MKALFYILSVSLLLVACGVKPIQFVGSNGVENYALGNGKIDFSVNAVVDNPNWFGIKLKKTDLEVYADSIFIGYLHLQDKVKIKRKREAEFKIPLQLMMEQGVMFKMLGLAKKEQVALRLRGEVKGGVFLFSKKMQIDQVKTVPMNGLKLRL